MYSLVTATVIITPVYAIVSSIAIAKRQKQQSLSARSIRYALTQTTGIYPIRHFCAEMAAEKRCNILANDIRMCYIDV